VTTITGAVLLFVVLCTPALSQELGGRWKGIARRDDGRRTRIVLYQVTAYTAARPGPFLQGLSGLYRCGRRGVGCLRRTGALFTGTIEDDAQTGLPALDLTVTFPGGGACSFTGVVMIPFGPPAPGDAASGAYRCVSRRPV